MKRYVILFGGGALALIGLGCIAFILLTVFDLNKLYNINKIINIFFGIGFLVIALSTFLIVYLNKQDFSFGVSLRLLFIFLCGLSFLLMIYTLFFALPFKKTYLLNSKINVINSGFYALCRHPGVYFFFFTFLFLWLSTGIYLVLYAGLIWTAFDVLHVWVQDHYYFPKILLGYDQYKKETPFLIPTINSFKSFKGSIRLGRGSR